VDVLDILRRQAGRFQCPKCGVSLAGCELEMVAHQENQSLVKVTCARCRDTRLIAVAIATETEPEPVIDSRDEPADVLGPPITADDVLDARLALAEFDGDLDSLLR
jgi:predicted nucleic-acid-binding Zn-ribbon protein